MLACGAAGRHGGLAATPAGATIFGGMTRAWVFLLLAGLLEAVWAVGLKASQGFTRPASSALTLAAMLVSVWLLALAMRVLPVGTAYAVWTGTGAVGAALVGIVLLGEPRTALRLASLALIVVGIVGLKLTSRA